MNNLREGEGMDDYAFPPKAPKRVKWHRWVYFVFVMVFGYLLFFHDAMSHDFYTIDCCSDKDCAPLPDGAVKITQSGYVWDGETFPFNDKRVKYSPDGKYHGCALVYTGTKLCLYVPPQGF